MILKWNRVMAKNIKLKNQTLHEVEAALISKGLLKKYGLKRVAIFGSVARGEDGNDVDILIDENIDPRTLIAFKDSFEKMIGKKVDIVIKKICQSNHTLSCSKGNDLCYR